jgi:hypothetical protein
MTQPAFRPAKYPSYSEEIILSDFFFFDWLGSLLARQSLVQMETIFQSVVDILINLTSGFVEHVSESKNDLLKQAFDIDSDYISMTLN